MWFSTPILHMVKEVAKHEPHNFPASHFHTLTVYSLTVPEGVYTFEQRRSADVHSNGVKNPVSYP